MKEHIRANMPRTHLPIGCVAIPWEWGWKLGEWGWKWVEWAGHATGDDGGGAKHWVVLQLTGGGSLQIRLAKRELNKHGHVNCMCLEHTVMFTLGQPLLSLPVIGSATLAI